MAEALQAYPQASAELPAVSSKASATTTSRQLCDHLPSNCCKLTLAVI